MLSKFGLHESEILEEVCNITDAQHFLTEFLHYGTDYGSNPDSGGLFEMLNVIADKDAHLASELRSILRRDLQGF